jgi:hypothetical protein
MTSSTIFQAVTMLTTTTSVTTHLIRGALAGACILGALAWASEFWPALGLLPVAIYLMRGCPACWLMGLLEAVQARKERCGSCRAGGRPD